MQQKMHAQDKEKLAQISVKVNAQAMREAKQKLQCTATITRNYHLVKPGTSAQGKHQNLWFQL